MKTGLIIFFLLIGTISIHGLEEKEEKSKQITEEKIKSEKSETKDKRQIGSSETASYSNEKQDDPEQPQETIYGPKPNHFLIHPISPHEQQLRNYQPTSRPQSQQLQAIGPQLEQSQEIQHYAYLQDLSRNHQIKAIAEGKSHTLSKKPSGSPIPQHYVSEEQYAQQQPQPQLRFTPAHGQFRPSEYIPQPQPQQHPQQQQGQYQTLQEEHLLKLIEDELQARAIQEAQSRESYPQPTQQSKSISVDRQGLVNYRTKPEESPEYGGYSQPQQVVPQQAPQYLTHPSQQQHRRPQPQPHQQVNFYHGPSAISYRTIPNHPLAESSLEKEIEKLLASNRPSGYRHSQPPAVLASRSPFLHQKSHSTTVAPQTTLGQASQYSYSPSVVQYSGFQPSPTAPTHGHQQKQYVPMAYSTAQPQYVIESSPPPTKPSKPSSHYRAKQQSQKSKQQNKQNVGPVQFYYNSDQSQQQQVQPPQQPQEYQQYPIPSAAPSQSSIFVSQSIQPSQKIKTQGNQKHLALPPPNGKPITEAEFQALIDAGYPVQAVPVPVPVPYEQYIKEHPEYEQEQVEIPHRHQQRGANNRAVTYLRPIPNERQQQQRHPRSQTEEVVPEKSSTS